MPQHHPAVHGDLDQATWVLLRLEVSEELMHYRASVIQSVGISLSVMVLGLGSFWFFGMIQRYRLASASLEQLEHIKHHFSRFVPRTVQKLIEDNPEQPLLDKVEREVTVLFLDIDHYTAMAAELAPGTLNRLIETYFSAFLDIILSHGGEINETAGDGIMAIFTGNTAPVDARNAVEAALAIDRKAAEFNRMHTSETPDILVNIGISSGQVLLGATMMRGAVGERLTYTASGMVTNIAARLCGLGAQGQIHLHETAAQFVAGFYTLHGPREVHLRHIQGAVLAYQASCKDDEQDIVRRRIV